MNELQFTVNGWNDYCYWQKQDKKTLAKINKLLSEITRDHMNGTGKPEPLKGDLSGCWSRHINDKDRIIYCILENNVIQIISCRSHYSDH